MVDRIVVVPINGNLNINPTRALRIHQTRMSRGVIPVDLAQLLQADD